MHECCTKWKQNTCILFYIKLFSRQCDCVCVNRSCLWVCYVSSMTVPVASWWRLSSFTVSSHMDRYVWYGAVQHSWNIANFKVDRPDMTTEVSPLLQGGPNLILSPSVQSYIWNGYYWTIFLCLCPLKGRRCSWVETFWAEDFLSGRKKKKKKKTHT